MSEDAATTTAPAAVEIPGLPDQPGFRELTPEYVDALADRIFHAPPPPPTTWLGELAELVAEKLKTAVRAEVRAAVKAEARKQTRETAK